MNFLVLTSHTHALAQRFYDPDSGSIELDGVNIQSLKLRWLREQMGLVSQEPILFQGTIAENIAWGAGGEDKITMEEIIEVCGSTLWELGSRMQAWAVAVHMYCELWLRGTNSFCVHICTVCRCLGGRGPRGGDLPNVENKDKSDLKSRLQPRLPHRGSSCFRVNLG